MRVIEGQTIEDLRHDSCDGLAVYSDLHLKRCRLIDSGLYSQTGPEARGTMRNCVLEDCEVHPSVGATGAIFDECRAENIKIVGDLIFFRACAFRHVTLRGRIGDFKMSGIAEFDDETATLNRAFERANSAFYEDVDWALDISEAEFGSSEFWGVPARLIRRDPKCQVVVTREKAMRGTWRDLKIPVLWQVYIQMLLERGLPDAVFAAPRRDRRNKFQNMVDGLNMLRDAGVAEPD